MAKAKKVKDPPASAADLSLTLSADGKTLTTTISPNAQWSGIQKFVDPNSNDGASSIGNWYYASPPGTGKTESVAVAGTGYYRGWSSDVNYTVHLSNVVFVP